KELAIPRQPYGGTRRTRRVVLRSKHPEQPFASVKDDLLVVEPPRRRGNQVEDLWVFFVLENRKPNSKHARPVPRLERLKNVDASSGLVHCQIIADIERRRPSGCSNATRRSLTSALLEAC